MSKADPTPRDLGLRSDSFTVDYPDRPTPRIIANVEAKQKVGKTDFCLRHVPDPVVIFNFDQGLEGVVDALRRAGKRIIVAGVPTKDPRKYPAYHFARPVPQRGEKRKDEGYLTRVKTSAASIWERWISDMDEFYKSDARTGVVDTGGGAYTLAKFAFVGMDKYTQKDDPYGQKSGDMKALFQGIVADGYSYDKNVLWVHRLKQEWKGGEPSGRMIASGYPDIAYEVQVTLRLSLDRKAEGGRTVEVRDGRIPPGGRLNGEEFDGKMYSFAKVAALLTSTDDEVWE